MGSLIWWKTRSFVSHLAWLLLTSVVLMAILPAAQAQGVGAWHASGSEILDANGSEVRIAGVNWYGFETTDEVAHGLYFQDYHQILSTIHALGYNTIRLPFSNQMVETPIIPTALANYNSTGPINTDLEGLNSLEIMDKIISAAGALGLKIILVNHRSEAGNSNEPSGLWYTPAYPETKWIADWQALATRYKSFVDARGNPIVIAVDLRNEPHLLANGARTGSCWTGDSWVAGSGANGCPLTNTAQNWPAAAERAANRILAINPNLLIAVEGTDCYNGDCGWQGGNLEGAAQYPVRLSVANRLVYSAHDYGPDLDKQAWFSSATTSASLDAVWTRYWAYLSIGKTAPVWLGEFGTTNATADIESNLSGSQGQWFSALTSFLANHPAMNWTYWAVNGEDDFALLDTAYGPISVSSLKQQMLASVQFRLSETGGVAACVATPALPTGLTASASASSAVQLAWASVPPPANCSVTYTVFRATTAGFAPASTNQIAAALTSPGFADSNLSPSTTYYYRVEAIDAHGASAASAQASAKTPAQPAGAACHVAYSVTSTWAGGFQASIAVTNTGTTPVNNWTLQWSFANGQTVTSFWNGAETQSGNVVTVKNEGYNGAIAPNATITGMGFTAADTAVNTVPASFTLNGVACK